MHPAAVGDLTIQQRGDEILLSFTHPQTTVSGLPLPELQAVEYWELVKAVPIWTPPSDTEAEEEESSETIEGAPDQDALEEPEEAAAAEEEPATEEGEATTTEEEGEEEEEEEEEAAEAPPPSKEELVAVDGLEFTATAKLRLKLEGTALTSAISGDRILVRLPIDRTAIPAAEVRSDTEQPELASIFSVKTITGPKLISSFSNLATLAYRTAPEPPRSFSVEAGPGGVTIGWEKAGEEVVAYNVYRRNAQSRYYDQPLASILAKVEPKVPEEEREAADEEVTPEETPRHIDRSAVFGQRYIYTLTAVSLQTPLVESALAGEQEIDYADRFPPSAPEKVIALAEPGRVRLLWNASPEDDVLGYHIYRRQRGGDFRLLNQEEVVDLEYSDRSVASTTRYEYQIVAVDREQNRSEPSVVVEAEVP
jgi:hypothetical protein